MKVDKQQRKKHVRFCSKILLVFLQQLSETVRFQTFWLSGAFFNCVVVAFVKILYLINF